MPATSANSRSSTPTRSRLPLTPKVTASRRGGHTAPRPARTAPATAPVAIVPELHVTPNVVSATRGGLGLAGITNLSDATQGRALDMRGVRI